MKLLVIEDSARLLRSLGSGLTKMGYAVDLVADGKEGLDYARYGDYDLIILDLLLPGMDGLTVLRKMRAMGKQTHVLILSAKDQVEDRIRGLELGADDYMVKPFSFEELCARISTLLRRKYESRNPEITIGPFTINTASRQVIRDGEPLSLTPAEYGTLEYLALNRGRVISKEQLLDAMHDSETYAGTNLVEVMVCTLRKKLSVEGADPIIQTRRGYGYIVE